MLGKLVVESYVHCFDIKSVPVFPDFGLEPPCLGEGHTGARITRADMLGQQRTVSELQGLKQVFTCQIDFAIVFDSVI